MTAHVRNKVLVIGLDGATFDLIRPWAEEGRLPHLARLMREGTWGPLRSTIPPNSCPAWTSCTTGVNPGRHGVFSFFDKRPDTYMLRPVSARTVRVPRLWEFLERQGITSGVLNVPVTYPPSRVEGYLIAGMLSPSLDTAVAPPELKERLLKWVPGYDVEAPVLDDPEDYLRRISQSIKRRRQAALALAEHWPTDFRMVVFTELDRLQHFYWAAMDESHPCHDRLAGHGVDEAIRKGYEWIDEAVGHLLETADEHTTVIIVSDHGFEPVDKMIFVNVWLREQGYLVLKRRTIRTSLLRGAKELIPRLGLERLARRVKWALPATRDIRVKNLTYASGIDWSRTRAAFGPNLGININLRGRDPMGIVEPGAEAEALVGKLQEDLMDLCDPDTGDAVLESVVRPEEVYHGDEIGGSADLLLVPAGSVGERGAYAYSPKLSGLSVLALPDRIAANHSPYGIFVAWGAGIRRSGHVEGARILDIAPTALRLFGLAVPSGMDGCVLEDVLLPQRVAAEPYDASATNGPGLEKEVLGEEDTAIVESRLRGLGYLD